MFRFVAISFILLSAISVFGQNKKSVVGPKTRQPSQCQLTQAPPLRGFFLGQTVDEIEKMIPGFRSAYNEEKENENSTIVQTDYRGSWENRLSFRDVRGANLSGYFDENSQLIIDDSSDTPKRPLKFSGDTEGLHKLVWWFFEEKLYGFSIYYADYDPDTAQSFIKQLSEKTNLPMNGWKKLKTDFPDARGIPGAPTFVTNVEAVLECNGFKARVHTRYRDSASITITDTNAEAKIMRLEREIKLQKKVEEQKRVRLEEQKRNTLKP